MPENPVICPSAKCETGSILLGLVRSNGEVEFLGHKVAITEQFVELAQQLDSPEAHFRFASPCMKGACQQWTGQRCGVIDKVMDLAPIEFLHTTLPDCAIRADCRWFKQIGERACMACPLVVTDTREQTDLINHSL